MKGLENATGLYFKVVDSDDWVDPQVLKDLLKLLRRFKQTNQLVDMVVSDFVYDKAGARHKKVMRYPRAIPTDRVLHWEDVGNFPKGHYLLMHSVIYRTQVLRDCGLDLPLHTFYVDNLFVYVPMTQVKTLYYVDRVFYHYFIGREDQSVQEAVMIRRINQQLKVNWLMFQQVDLDQVENQRLRRYLLNYLEIVTTVSCVLLYRSGTPEHLEMERRLLAGHGAGLSPPLCPAFPPDVRPGAGGPERGGPAFHLGCLPPKPKNIRLQLARGRAGHDANGA